MPHSMISNLISLSQLQETDILSHNYPKCMVLKIIRKTIRFALRKKNLFIFNIQTLTKTTLVKDKGRLIYLFSKNL